MSDPDLRAIFTQEAEHLLGLLSGGALELEGGVAGPARIDELFRAAHTLKGSAAMVGLPEVGAVTHALEDLLEQLRSGRLQVSGAVVDVILETVDALRQAIPPLLAGEPVGIVGPGLAVRLAELTSGRGADGGAPAPTPPVPAVPVRPVPAPEPPPAPVGAPEATETVAVPLSRLDRLVRLAGESRTARLRVAEAIGEAAQADPEVEAAFADLDRALETLQRQLLAARMVTLTVVAEPLRRAVREIARQTGKTVDYTLDGGRVELDRAVLDALREPLLHLVRNAVDHGIEAPDVRLAAGKPATGTVRVWASRRGQALHLQVSDDGRGLDADNLRTALGAPHLSDAEALDRIFAPGVSTAAAVTTVSGRGVGLDVVRTAVERARGTVTVVGRAGEGTTFTLVVPVSLAVVRCLLVQVADERYAIPAHAVLTIVEADEEALVGLEGGAAVWVAGDIVPLGDLGRTLGAGGHGTGPAVVVTSGTRRQALRVDTLLGQRDVTLQSLGSIVADTGLVAGASIEPDGSVLLVLDPATLLTRAGHGAGPPPTPTAARRIPGRPGAADPAPAQRATILVVEDALTVRELQRSILERAGYTVVTAADGRLALGVLADLRPDLVLTDIEMPNLDGFGLIEAIRAQPRLASVPVLIMSSRDDPEDRARGLQVGADGYIVKRAFDEVTLLAAVSRMLGTSTSTPPAG